MLGEQVRKLFVEFMPVVPARVVTMTRRSAMPAPKALQGNGWRRRLRPTAITATAAGNAKMSLAS